MALGRRTSLSLPRGASADQRNRLPSTPVSWPGSSPSGATVESRVIAVLAPHSSTKTSRSRSVPASCWQNSRRSRPDLGTILLTGAGALLLLAVQPQLTQARGRWSSGCTRGRVCRGIPGAIASNCLRINSRNRSRYLAPVRRDFRRRAVWARPSRSCDKDGATVPRRRTLTGNQPGSGDLCPHRSIAA